MSWDSSHAPASVLKNGVDLVSRPYALLHSPCIIINPQLEFQKGGEVCTVPVHHPLHSVGGDLAEKFSRYNPQNACQTPTGLSNVLFKPLLRNINLLYISELKSEIS